jgi:hypothetical protein
MINLVFNPKSEKKPVYSNFKTGSDESVIYFGLSKLNI